MKTRAPWFLFSLLVLSVTAAGQETVPPDADAFFQKAMARINRKHVSWVRSTALDVNNRNLDENAINAEAKTYGQLSGMGDMDIMALAFLVLMQASKDQQEDLKAIMDRVKKTNAEKKKIRDAQQHLEETKNPVTRQVLDSFRLIARPGSNNNALAVAQPARIQTAQPVKRVNTDSVKRINVIATQKVTSSEIKQAQHELKTKLDSMNEMSEMTSLRLQMMMDRRSKFISTLSNIMKKISDTQNTIVQNLK